MFPKYIIYSFSLKYSFGGGLSVVGNRTRDRESTKAATADIYSLKCPQTEQRRCQFYKVSALGKGRVNIHIEFG